MSASSDDRAWFMRSRTDPHARVVGGLYWFLAALFIITLAIALLWPEHELVARFAPNFTTEVLGIIITLAFVQRLLQRQERARRMRASIGAFRRAGRALSRLIAAWADILKGCHPGDGPPLQLERVFAPAVTEHFGSFDPHLQRSGDAAARSWGRWLLQELDAAHEELNRVIVAYGGALDPAYTEAADELSDHPFIDLVRQLIAGAPDPQLWRRRMHTSRGHREDYFRHLLATMQLHDRLAAEAATVRSRDRVPRTGTIGMELPRDYDLKVMVRLDREWRALPPLPGSLRVSRPSVASDSG